MRFPRLHRPGWLAALAWIGWAVSFGLLYVQHQAGVLHPQVFLFLFLLIVTLLSGLCGAGAGLWRFVRGPRRRSGLGLAAGAALPVLCWLGLAGYARAELARGNAPNNLPWKMARLAAVSVMEAQAFIAYPDRLETENLVMYYDNRITTPERDAQEMEKHVAGLVKKIGKPLRAKIHWVRGNLLGMGRLAAYGLALGSDFSPTDWQTADHPDHLSLDRHELAHAVLHQFYEPDTDPPFLLAEGWAESQAGTAPKKRASWALQSWQLWLGKNGSQQSYLRDLVGAARYHHIDGAVYNVGGAFAEYLLGRYGPDLFLEFYFACRPGNFEAMCVEKLGIDLDTLEGKFWQEVKNLAGPP